MPEAHVTDSYLHTMGERRFVKERTSDLFRRGRALGHLPREEIMALRGTRDPREQLEIESGWTAATGQYVDAFKFTEDDARALGVEVYTD